MRPEALEHLRDNQVKLPPSVPTIITFRNADVRALVELEIEPREVISPSEFQSVLPQCPACGRVQAKAPDKIVIQASSVPSSVDIFRDQLISTVILAAEHLVEAVKSLKLSGIKFEEVTVV